MPRSAAAVERGRRRLRGLLLLEQLCHQARDRGAPAKEILLSEPPSLRVFPSASLAEELEHGRGTQRWPASLRPLQAQASPRFLEALNWQTTRARSAPPPPQAPKCNGEGRSHG